MHALTLLALVHPVLSHLDAVLPAPGGVGEVASHLAEVLLGPLPQIPNPFCNLVTIIKPWVGGAIILGLLAGAAGFGLRFVMPEASIHLMNGLKGMGIGLFIAGLALTPASLTEMAT